MAALRRRRGAKTEVLLRKIQILLLCPVEEFPKFCKIFQKPLRKPAEFSWPGKRKLLRIGPKHIEFWNKCSVSGFYFSHLILRSWLKLLENLIKIELFGFEFAWLKNLHLGIDTMNSSFVLLHLYCLALLSFLQATNVAVSTYDKALFICDSCDSHLQIRLNLIDLNLNLIHYFNHLFFFLPGILPGFSWHWLLNITMVKRPKDISITSIHQHRLTNQK